MPKSGIDDHNLMAYATGYSLSAYGRMVLPGPRIDAYAMALERAVKPGSIVFDIGAGPGVLALLACKFGAARVYLIEPDASLDVARELFAANGFSDRAVYVSELSTRFTPEQRADVIVSDLRGILPLFEGHLHAIADARARLLAPGGILLPTRDRIYAALVQAPTVYDEIQAPWHTNDMGLDLRLGLPYVLNDYSKQALNADDMITPRGLWAELDYMATQDADVKGQVAWTIETHAVAHGLLVWFDASLLDEIGYSNAPGQPKLVYGQTLFPFLNPLSLSIGDQVTVDLRADLIGGDYVWTWNTRHVSADGTLRATYRQSTFNGLPLSRNRPRRSEGFVPQLSEDATVKAFVFAQMDGRRSLGEIAAALRERFPVLFPRAQDALARAADLAERHAR